MKLSREERKAGVLTQSSEKRASQLIHDQGYVVLEKALPSNCLKKVRKALNQVLAIKYKTTSKKLGYQRGHGGVSSPLSMPFIDPMIIENPFAFQILRRIFGDRFFGCLPYGCNTSFPGSKAQNIHRDCGHIFPEINVPVPPLLIVVNIALDDFKIENGATEIWPGSHFLVDGEKDETATLRISKERSSEKISKPLLMPSGSIVIRDMRTWHRGMPNRTKEPRTMLSIVYYRQFLLPDNFQTDVSSLPKESWDQFSDRAKAVYRLTRLPSS